MVASSRHGFTQSVNKLLYVFLFLRTSLDENAKPGDFVSGAIDILLEPFETPRVLTKNVHDIVSPRNHLTPLRLALRDCQMRMVLSAAPHSTCHFSCSVTAAPYSSSHALYSGEL